MKRTNNQTSGNTSSGNRGPEADKGPNRNGKKPKGG
jgi:hypothetical protein